MPNIRLKCSCGARLKVPDSVAGGKIRCWQCGVKLDVPGVAGSKTDELALPPEFQKPWIRITCECGKTIKSPPDWVGKHGQCPRCKREMLMIADPQFALGEISQNAVPVVAPTVKPPDDIFSDLESEDFANNDQKTDLNTTLNAIDLNDDSGSDSFDILLDDESSKPPIATPSTPASTPKPIAKPAFKPATSIPASPVPSSIKPIASVPAAPPRQPVSGGASSVAQDNFIRVTCPCGKIVKAPLEWAGTVGNCPRCGKKILMPKAPVLSPSPVRQPAKAAPITPAKQTSHPITAADFEESGNDDSAVMDSILSEDEVPTLTAKGVSAQEWEKKKEERLKDWTNRRRT